MDECRNALASLKNVQGRSGKISYAGAPLFHNPVKDIFILKWAKGKQQCVTHFYPKVVPAIQ